MLRLDVASKTDVGLERAANEDACEVVRRPDGALLLVVADGMGGHRGGAVASRTAVETIAVAFLAADGGAPLPELIESSIREANARIYVEAQRDRSLEGMGTTVVALALDADGAASVAHVGDSRAYRLRDGRLSALTDDHSVVGELVRQQLLSPEEAARHPRRHEILRSVGILPEVAIDLAPVDCRTGDRFLLCSDGLCGVLRDDEIESVLRTEPANGAVETLVRHANESGGPDNVTVQVLEVVADGEPTAATDGVQADAPSTGGGHARGRGRSLAAALLGGLAVLGLWLIWRGFAGG